MCFRGIVLALAAALSALAESKLLRHPTYHNGRVAFSYLGDIWVAGENGTGAQRLTDHRARDIYPRFSPDGKWVAFSSNRFGNYDVFVVASEGGAPKQLTFHSGADTVVGWSPDGRRVIFSAARGVVFPGVGNLYGVPSEGGLEQLIPTDWGSWGSYSPDASKLAYTRHSTPWWRKHYRGSNANDLWLMDASAKTFRKLVDDEYKGNCSWPLYGRNGEIFFVADRLPNEKGIAFGGPEVMKSVNNIWKVSDRGGRPVQVTKHTSGNLFFPSISSDGRTIVYEENFGIWKLDTASGKTVELKFEIATDDKENDFELRTIQNEADSFHLSPSTRRAAISTHGEIFTVATERGEPRRVTESYWRDMNPAWSPDGKWIAFVSDRSGREEIWLTTERGGDPRKLTDADTDKISIEWAPDSKSLLYTASDKKLHRVEIESGKTQALATGEVGNIGNPRFSPDGKWISYTRTSRDLRPRVAIISTAGGEERTIGGDVLFSSTFARWTPDGRKLLVLGGVAQAGSIASTRQPTMQLYAVTLTREDRDPRDRGVDSEEEAQAAGPARGRGPAGAATSSSPPDVRIEWESLDRRIRQLTRLADNVITVTPSPDSRLYAFVAAGQSGGRFVATLYTIQEDGERLTRVAQSGPPEGAEDGPPPQAQFGGGGLGSLQFSRDGRTIYYQEGRGMYSASVGGGEGAAPVPMGRPAERRRVSFTARVEIDHDAERRQVFNESWRVMKNRFYDPKMHGVDWVRMRETYEPLLTWVADQEELHNVVMNMIGELNASHTGIGAGGGGGGAGRGTLQTRYPGFELEPDASGYFKVAHVYRKGPADHDFVKIAAGNYVLAIDGKDIKAGDNYWRHYALAPGRKLEFTVNSKPAAEGAWKAVVEPVGVQPHTTLQYEKWVEDRRRMVEKTTNGEIGYLHIRAMNAPSLEQFQRDLMDNRDKKALIIDQRFNGGGGIDQELLQILGQRLPYQSTRSRNNTIDVPRPLRAFFGPMVVMQNERSGSNAEMFPDGFRALGLGKVIGVPTYGGVIGTGSYTLLDGSAIRTPGSGVFNAKGVNMENYGVPPDIHVDVTPEDFLRGRDTQIDKAIEVLRAEMKK